MVFNTFVCHFFLFLISFFNFSFKAYLRFWLQFQPEFMEKNKNIKLANAAKIAGKEWFHLGDIQRKLYEDESQSHFQRFRIQIDEYRANDGYKKWDEMKQSYQINCIQDHRYVYS